jgi:hypothetical protein
MYRADASDQLTIGAANACPGSRYARGTSHLPFFA